MGDRGPAVRDLQRRLGRLAGTPLPAGGGLEPAGGVFDEALAHAVKRFQQERGLAADGVVGVETWRCIVEAGFALGDRLLWHSRTMMRGDDVREFQHRLNQLGFDAGTEDGIFGPLTQSALEEFQRNAGINVDGVAGPETIAALRRLHRDHQTGGAAARAREREALRRLTGRGLPGARILVDPAHGPADPGHVGPGGDREAEVTWALASQLAARLRALGAVALLARGPRTTPSPSERARFANEQGVDVAVSIALAGHPNPRARGSASYYYGDGRFVSEAGRALAELLQEAVVGAGFAPDCRTHAMTWPILRETRMPSVVVEPGFLTCPEDERALREAGRQAAVADALTQALVRFFAPAVPEPV